MAERTALTLVSAWNQLMITSENASIAPHERSNAPAVNGTSTASPRMPITTWSARTILNVAWVRNVDGIQMLNSTRISARRYSTLALPRPGSSERRGLSTGAGLVTVVVTTGLLRERWGRTADRGRSR